MKKAVGLAAAAAAATLGTGGINAAMAGTPTVVGSVMVSLNANDPTIVIANTTGSSFTGQIMLDAFWGSGRHASSVIASGLTAHHSTTFKFGSGHTGGGSAHQGAPFRLAKTRNLSVTAGVEYQVVGSGFKSAKFGNPVHSGSQVVDWLGGGTKASTTRATAAEIYATPEPATVLLLTAGVVGLGVTRRRRVQAGVR